MQITINDIFGINADECVAICSVDPYVGKEYHEAIKRLEILVHMSSANLTLIGIEPTYPGEKIDILFQSQQRLLAQ